MSVALGAIAALSKTLLTGREFNAATTAVSFTCLVVIAGPVVSLLRLERLDWFFPFALPVAYVTLALMTPLLFLTFSDGPLGFVQPAQVTNGVVIALGLTILGILVGLAVPVLGMAPVGPRTPLLVDRRGLRSVGRAFLVSSLVGRIFVVRGQFGRAYGEGSVGFSWSSVTDNLASALLLAGVVLVFISNVSLRRKLGGALDWTILGFYVIASLLVGNRSELLAPALLALWARHHYIRPIKLSHLVALSLTLILLFQAIQALRVSEPVPGATRTSVVERVLFDFVSPVYLTAETMKRVPDSHPFLYGSTYLAGVKRLLPSPLANTLFGPTDDTGTFVFRDLVGFKNPNAGLGFSLPTEGFLNFGFFGCLMSGIFTGLVLGFSYRHTKLLLEGPVNLLYPIMVSTLPLGLRSDALGQMKGVAYPMLLIALAVALKRRHSRRRTPDATDFLPGDEVGVIGPTGQDLNQFVKDS